MTTLLSIQESCMGYEQNGMNNVISTSPTVLGW